MSNGASGQIFFVMQLFFLLEKSLENKDFASPTWIFKLVIWAPKKLDLYHSDVMGKSLPSK